MRSTDECRSILAPYSPSTLLRCRTYYAVIVLERRKGSICVRVVGFISFIFITPAAHSPWTNISQVQYSTLVLDEDVGCGGSGRLFCIVAYANHRSTIPIARRCRRLDQTLLLLGYLLCMFVYLHCSCRSVFFYSRMYFTGTREKWKKWAYNQYGWLDAVFSTGKEIEHICLQRIVQLASTNKFVIEPNKRRCCRIEAIWKYRTLISTLSLNSLVLLKKEPPSPLAKHIQLPHRRTNRPVILSCNST